MSRAFTVFVLLLLFSCNAQDVATIEKADKREPKNETEENIYRSGDSMLAAFRRKDWGSFVKYNHPNMTSRMGGAEAFASFITMQMKQIPDTVVKSITIGSILQVVTTDKDVQCVVEQHMKMEQQGTTLDKTTYLIGESLDNGKSWTFFDASAKTGLLPKDIKPDLSDDLKIPAVRNEINQ
jgi:hypothetical protein